MEQGFIGVEVSGARELRRAVSRAGGPGARAELTKIHRQAADSVATLADRLVDVDTGELQDSIAARGSLSRATVSAGGRAAPHGRPHHSGDPTRGLEPNEFITDAVSERYEYIRKDIDDAYRKLAKSFES